MTGQRVWKQEMPWPANHVVFSPDGTRIAADIYDDTVHVWDVATGQELQVLQGANHGIHSLAYSPDGKLLAAGVCKEEVHPIGCMVDDIWIWEVETAERVKVIGGQEGLVTRLAFSPDGTLLASGWADIHLWDAATGNQIMTLEGYTFDFSPSGTLLVTGSPDATLRLWIVER